MTRSLSITLPTDMAQMVEAKVASGDYATESDVIRDGLHALQARDAAVEHWLCTDVAATYDANRSDPSRGLSADQVLGALEKRFAAARKAFERGAYGSLRS